MKAADGTRILDSVAHHQVISPNLDVINQNLPVVSAQIDRNPEEMMI
jgi:hypothetical protein